MNRETLEPFRRQRYSGALVGNGYDRIPVMHKLGWKAMPSWGRDGWDLGDWPLVVFYGRVVDVGLIVDPQHPTRQVFELATDVEGDIDSFEFPTEALRSEAIDYLFAWYAVSVGQDWANGWDPEDETTVPVEYRGPYRSEDVVFVGSVDDLLKAIGA